VANVANWAKSFVWVLTSLHYLLGRLSNFVFNRNYFSGDVMEKFLRHIFVISPRPFILLFVAIVVSVGMNIERFAVPVFGQQIAPAAPKFKTLPGYKSYQAINKARTKLNSTGRIRSIGWSNDGKSINFRAEGKKKHFVFETGDINDGNAEGKSTTTRNFSPRGKWDASVGRAKQAASVQSPDKKFTALYRDNNVFLKPVEGEEIQITKDGSTRRRFGTGCWVYGEELYQSQAMWWSADSQQLVFYEMNEEHMRDYNLTINNAVNPMKKGADLYTKLDTVRYPTAGMPNPHVNLHVYDLKSKKIRQVKIYGPEDQYLFNVKFAPNGHLLVNRTNRHQNHLEILSINLEDMTSKVVVSEQQETWQNNLPMMYFLDDGNRFVWETERTGWKHYELRDLDGNRINNLTDFRPYPVNQILRLDEATGYVFFTAFSDQENPLNQHLHRVKLDGSEHKKLTSKNLNHTSFSISPDAQRFTATYEAVDTPPTSAIYDMDGNELSVLSSGTVDVAKELKLSPPELFHFTASDGESEIYGILHKPSNFDPNRKYPLIIDVYGGPQSSAAANTYNAANSYCEFGYLIAKIANRGTDKRGKKFESAGYMKLGDLDIQDQADGVKFLRKRKYVDGKRVGVYGHSYGGYMSALAVLKYPDVFHVAVSGAPVTDWRNYDTIYTERYMRTPQENQDGYNNGSCIKYVKQLKGNLLLVHGLIDDNVHPSNTLQLVNELHNANVRFDIQVFPNNKHGIGGPYNSIRWEYFHKHLKPTVASSSRTGITAE